MPNHRIRRHPIGAPQRRQRQLQPHQHRLHPRIPGHRLAINEHLPQRKPHLLNKGGFQLLDRGSERRLIGQQLPGHPRPLRTLTRIHKHPARLSHPRPGSHHTHRRLTSGQRLQPGHRLGTITRTHRGDVLIPSAMMIKRVRDIGQRHIGALAGHPLGQHRSHRRDPLRGLTRNHQRRDHRLRLGSNSFGDRSLFNHNVGIGAAHPKRRHPRPTRPIHRRPRHPFSSNREPRRTLHSVGRQRREIKMRRDITMPHTEHRLDETSNT